MAPPENGNEKIDFTKLIALDKLDSTTFRSKALAFGPANGNRTYGGHVYMQACYAAAQTVPKGMALHNVTGWFLLLGKADERFTYRVRKIRDGGYCTRGVDVLQETGSVVSFTCICSFKRPERKSTKTLDIQSTIDLRKEYAAVLGNKRPDEHQEMPGVDAPWYWEFSRRNNNYTDPFPGLTLHKVDMERYNSSKPPLERRNLKYYSVIGGMPSVEEDINMHICAHLYASDRNSLFVISNNLGIGNDYSQIASLSHTVIMHADGAELSMVDRKTGQPLWFVQEAWTGGSRHGRGLHQSRMWREDGLQVASTIQDGMMRLKSDDGKGKAGFSPEQMAQQLEEKLKKDRRQGKL
ncbi:uncharacterized protein LTR77_004855 [Saxophila tyrrhenica]|uniref:Thioesterase/thiol ester dehydrase-isomerase n=1 Tax=Saxophila tyrrhenica TaxID=1690608 RepID=A0AAV9PCP5_9PEZI|nr:hypothetical protein LTR77_004855 [Saxophila tyrrhenica]